MLTALTNLLSENQIDLTPQWDGQFVREGAQWFVGSILHINGKDFYACSFGDWSKGLTLKWTSSGEFSKEENIVAQAKLREVKEAAAKRKILVQHETALQCERDFATFGENGEIPYLTRKKIKGLYGARVFVSVFTGPGAPLPQLIIPMRDIDGKLWNFQRIYSETERNPNKLFALGARITGTFHVLSGAHDSLKNASEIFVAEGFATAASIYEALKTTPRDHYSVVCTFTATNLGVVSKELRGRYPSAQLTICADNDAYTVINGEPTNVGLIKAGEAAAISRASLVYPTFHQPREGLTDFNDLACTEGLEAVAHQLSQAQPYKAPLDTLSPNTPQEKEEKPKKPSEKYIAEAILQLFQGKLVRIDKEFFMFKRTHWVLLDGSGTDELKNAINSILGNKLSSKEVDSYYRTLVRYIPAPPEDVDLYSPNPYVCNFENGSLYYRGAVGQATAFLEFVQGHRPSDYLIHCLPYKYDENVVSAPKFEEMLLRLWNGDAHQLENVRLVKQVMGACLLPIFPRIVTFWGPPKSGKSTIVLLMQRLLGFKNYCSVQPSEMNAFNMEPMIGKLANLVTELKYQAPMQDHNLKSIIDGTIQIQRKFKQAIIARLPALHLFATNGLPKSMDGDAKAYGRRLIIIKTGKFIADEKYNMNFLNELFEEEKEGILSVAIEGLLDLIRERGHFSVPQGSREALDEMYHATDLVEQFVESVKEQEIFTAEYNRQLKIGEYAIKKSLLYETYFEWQKKSEPDFRKWLNKNEFLRRIETKGFASKRTTEARYFLGIGIEKVEDLFKDKIVVKNMADVVNILKNIDKN